MRVLGLDLGRRRIGLALSDPEGRIASPAGTLERRSLRADLRALRALCREQEVERIVVGLPIHMNGRIGPEAEQARAFARTLSEATGLPVDTLDERWTTREAERALQAGGGRRHKGAARRRGTPNGGTLAALAPRSRRGERDAVAAALVLRTYLARREAAPRPDAGS